jgi:hypothetical protein
MMDGLGLMIGKWSAEVLRDRHGPFRHRRHRTAGHRSFGGAGDCALQLGE